MDGTDGGDGHHMRADHSGQGCDLVGVVHADLEDRALGIGRHPGQGQGNPDVVVVALDRGMGASSPGQARCHGLGDAGLSHRTGDCRAPGLCGPLAGGDAQGLERKEGVRDQDVGRVDRA